VYIESHLCIDEGVLPGIDEFDHKHDFFAFRAKSSVWLRADGRLEIQYQMPLFVKPGRTGNYNGAKYLVDWTALLNQKVRDNNRYHVAPLFEQYRDHVEDPDPDIREHYRRIDEESRYRFMRYELQNAFVSTIRLDKGHVQKLDRSAKIRVFDLELEEVGSFTCPTFVESN